MAQGFWSKKGSITIIPDDLSQMGEEGARMLLAAMFWGSATKQICPRCKAADHHYPIRTRRQWRCKHCTHTFSVTSGTPFSNTKMGHLKLATAILQFINHHKGLPALELARTIRIQYRNCWVLLQKIRAAIQATIDKTPLSGVVEIDGAHCSGRMRKTRKKKKAKVKIPKKYLKGHRAKYPKTAFPFHPNRRILIILREVFPGAGKGAGRSLAAVCNIENAENIEALVKKYVARGTLIRTDELPGYGNLKLMGYRHEVVNHSKEFCTDTGVNQNQAESYFSRYTRAEIGVYHRIAPDYMDYYANEMIWREDVRRVNNREQMRQLVARIFKVGVLRDWTNYCRGNRRSDDSLFRP